MIGSEIVSRDAPNAWPPHQYIIINALRAIPTNLSTTPVPSPASGQTTFSLIPSGQLDLTADQLPGQPLRVSGTNATVGDDLNKLNGTVVNGGNATSGETWSQTLQREMANRYFTSALCSWHATGGSIPGLLPQLPDSELNVTGSIGNTGNVCIFRLRLRSCFFCERLGNRSFRTVTDDLFVLVSHRCLRNSLTRMSIPQEGEANIPSR